MAANGEDPPPDVTPDVVFDEDDVAPDNQDADAHAPFGFAENVTIDGSSLNVVATFERNMSKCQWRPPARRRRRTRFKQSSARARSSRQGQSQLTQDTASGSSLTHG